jgi:membrane protease YdiL (CAAX protease family)
MSPDAPTFSRRKHLLFALVALLHAPLAMRVGDVLSLVVGAYPGSAEFDTIARLIHLCFAALVAWLAFAVFDTRSGVTILPQRWRDAAGPVVVFVVLELAIVATQWLDPYSRPSPFVGPLGELLVGWLIVSMLAGAAAEELVYRALLLRALEGFMRPWIALALHALVFAWVHVFVYGYGFAGGYWFGAGLVYGYAFQRTKSVAVPTLIHATHNVLFYTMMWLVGR